MGTPPLAVALLRMDDRVKLWAQPSVVFRDAHHGEPLVEAVKKRTVTSVHACAYVYTHVNTHVCAMRVH